MVKLPLRAHSDGPGKGAVFQVRIPWVDAELETLPGHDSSTESSAPLSDARLRGVTVLLVEDDATPRWGSPSGRRRVRSHETRRLALVIPLANPLFGKPDAGAQRQPFDVATSPWSALRK